MQHVSPLSEAVKAITAGNAGLLANGFTEEDIDPRGVYTVQCVGPRLRDQERYAQLRDGAEAARLACDFDLQDKLLAELATIPLEEKWVDEVQNLVTTPGKNDLLDKYLAGSAYTAAWYLGLIGTTSYSAVAAADTAASHAGWTESVVYSNGTRPAPTFNAASAGSKATTATAFNINGGDTIKGCFLISNSTKSGTTGILYSAGLFTGGDKVVANTDTLNVTYTASA